MIEMNDLVLLGIVSCVISAFVAAFGAVIQHTIRNRDVNVLSKKVESLEMAYRGAIGNSKREEQNEEMQNAMLEAAQIMQDPKIEDKKAALIAVAAKHPAIAMKLAKKYIGL